MNRLAVTIIILLLALAGVYIYTQTTLSHKVLRVSTTTSLYATGLLDELAKKFEETHPNVIIHYIPVGSGEALKKASLGDADLVLVHAPNLEKKYIDMGVLIDGEIFAYNYFIIVGPPNDPAGIKGLKNATQAFKKIMEAGESGIALFVSRGDNSGTNNRELYIWNRLGVRPSGDWYIEAGAGMAQTLEIADEKAAYTLSDTGTYLKLKKTGAIHNLDILVSGDPILINVYSVYLVNPDKFSGINYQLAKEFKEFIVSNTGKKLIGEYGLEEFGEPLFHPATKDNINELREAWSFFASP